jgi:hypothetical protein
MPRPYKPTPLRLVLSTEQRRGKLRGELTVSRLQHSPAKRRGIYPSLGLQAP